ncbi:hypothetical protein H8959_000668 [Pygathrix nigripes]
MSRVLQKDAEQESQMRAEIQDMKQELSTVNMMDEFARYARLERKINKMTDKLKTHVKARTAQLAKIKWVISVAFYVLQAALMISLIWKYYSVPVAVVPSKWITPLDRLVAFPTRVAGQELCAAGQRSIQPPFHASSGAMGYSCSLSSWTGDVCASPLLVGQERHRLTQQQVYLALGKDREQGTQPQRRGGPGHQLPVSITTRDTFFPQRMRSQLRRR